MSVTVLLGLIFVTLLYIARKLEVIGQLIWDGRAELKDKLERILVQTDYASMYLGRVTEMVEKAGGRANIDGSELPGSA